MFKSAGLSLKPRRSPHHDEQILALAMKQIEKMLRGMQGEGKELPRIGRLRALTVSLGVLMHPWEVLGRSLVPLWEASA